MTEEAVKNFLYETLGYRRIDDFVRGKRDADTSLRKFLDDTILGTFGTRASPASNIIVGNVEMPAWTRKYITVPHIFSASELEEQIERGKGYLTNLYREDVLRLEIQERGFFLSNFTVFVGYTGSRVRDAMTKIHEKGFPEADYQFEIRGRFRGHIKEDGFYLFTEGSTSRSGGKFIVASFNLSEEVVKYLNGIPARYHYLMQSKQSQSHQ